MGLSFYKNKMPYKEKQFNKMFSLPLYFKELIGDKKEVNIADLGAGMFSTTGSIFGDVKINIYPSDLLADEYNKLLKEAGIKAVIPVVKQDMESLTYDDNSFDIVHCVNALDHINSPLKALEEMYRVCKPNGFIYLRHFVDVAEGENYRGGHHWNIRPVNGDCHFWHRDASFLISSYLNNYTVSTETINNSKGEPEEMVVLIIQK